MRATENYLVKVVHVIFEFHHEAEVLALLHREVGIPDYTRVDDVVLARSVDRPGRRAYRMDDRNSLIIITCSDEVAQRIAQGMAALRQRLGRGLRCYAVPAEEVV